MDEEREYTLSDEYFPFFEGEFETDEDGNVIFKFSKKEYEEIVSLAMDCNLSVKELIFYRLFGCTEI